MALSDFTGPDYIDAWTEDLDRRWPERAAMAGSRSADACRVAGRVARTANVTRRNRPGVIITQPSACWNWGLVLEDSPTLWLMD